MSNKYVKLIMVTAGNNNKYYEMTEKGSSFEVKYGRVESTATVRSYPISQWDSKYNEKVKKGYRDVTHTVSTTVVDATDTEDDNLTMAEISDAKVQKFMALMKKYTDGLVAKTYTVKAKDVTQAQVDEAQGYLDDMRKLKRTDINGINSLLLELYMVIPRYMSHVTDHLLPNINLDKTLESEQDNLDAMASQVAQIKTVKDKKKKKTEKKESQTLLDVLGIQMKEISGHPDIKYLLDQLKGSNKPKAIFELNKPSYDKTFDSWMKTQKNKQTRFLLHGTRCSSVIPIIETGLKIRPMGNFSFSGKAYGDGNYFSETCVKSLGYTGWDSDKVMFVFEVHTGNPFTYNGWYRGNDFSLTYSELQKRGFDSTFVAAGNGLLNSEIIAYKEEQCTLRYIIWI